MIKPASQFSDEWAICPNCLERHGDCWEWIGHDTVEMTCSNCGQVFSVEPIYSVTYRTYVAADAIANTPAKGSV